MKIRDVMNKQVIAIQCESSITELESLLLAEHISGVPVTSASGKLMGVISKTDLLRRYRQLLMLGSKTSRHDLAATRVYEIMSPTVLSVSPEYELGTVARKMVESRYHRVIVTDPDDKIVGIVSSLDIMRLVGTVG